MKASNILIQEPKVSEGSNCSSSFNPDWHDCVGSAFPLIELYEPDADGREVLPQPVEAGRAKMQNWDEIVRSYKPRLHAASGPVLVLGAADGRLMDALRRQGLEVIGCEPSARLTRFARQTYGFDECTLQCSEPDAFLEWLNRIGRKVQAVFLWRVLEHTFNPYILLRQTAAVLDEEGLAIVEVIPPASDDNCKIRFRLTREDAIVQTAIQCGLELESIDCDFDNSFSAFVFQKIFIPRSGPVSFFRTVGATAVSRV